MKRIVTILLVVLTLQVNAQEWAPIGATWYYNYDISTGWFGVPGTSYSIFESVGDTTIEGIDCRKIVKSKDYTFFQQANQEYTYYNNDSVFFYDFNFSEFQLLYDFDANVGEFWYYCFVGDSYVGDIDSIKTVVDSTDFVTINSIILKRLYVHYEPVGFETDWMFDDLGTTNQSQIIAFIGDMKNLISTYFLDENITDVNCPSGLRCYEDLFMGHYETGIVDSCNYVNLLGQSDFEKETFTIYPNPSTNKIYLNHQTEFYQIYSSDGRLIQSGQVTAENSIDVTNLQNGIYFLLLNDVAQAVRFIKEE